MSLFNRQLAKYQPQLSGRRAADVVTEVLKS
jgi:hypothetical protein